MPWFDLTDAALGAKERKHGAAYTVRARYGPVLNSSDDSGVVVMVSRPSAVPNEPRRANCELPCVSPWFGLTDGALGAKERKHGAAYTVHARYGPVLTSSDDSGVVVMVSRPSAVPNEPWRANCELRVFRLGLASPTGHWGPRSESMALHTWCVRLMDQC